MIEELFSNLVTELEYSLIDVNQDTDFTIKKFVEQEVDKEKWGVSLTLRQWAILKAFYNEKLTVEEESVLELWAEQKRTTWDREQQSYQALILEAGRRASKTFIASIIGSYEFYKLCVRPSPQKYYRIASSTPIVILVLATSSTQTKRTIFPQILGVLECCKFFQLLVKQKKIECLKEEIKYPEKKLAIYSGNSSSGSQVGQSIILLIMDECARFPLDDTENNALSIWSNLRKSSLTFGKDGRQVAISSAWCEGDAIQELYSAAEIEPSWLAFRLRTWDIRPEMSRDNPIVASDYAINPRKAALEYEGIRHSPENMFFDQAEVKHCIRGRSVVKFHIPEPVNFVELQLLEIEPYAGATYMHLDPAVSADSYVLAFGHGELNEANQIVVVIDGIAVWTPVDGHPVSFTNIHDTILAIHKHRPIQKVTTDTMQSAETIQRLRMAGINASSYPFTNAVQLQMYDTMRVLMHEERLILPRDTPWKNRMLDEGVRIQLSRGVKIDHPKNGSKDIWDAIGGVTMLIAGNTISNPFPSPIILKRAADKEFNNKAWSFSAAEV